MLSEPVLALADRLASLAPAPLTARDAAVDRRGGERVRASSSRRCTPAGSRSSASPGPSTARPSALPAPPTCARAAGSGRSCPGTHAMPAPYAYRCPIRHCRETCDCTCLDAGFELVDQQSVGSLAAMICEPILSSAGVIVPPDGWLARGRRALREPRHAADRGRGADRASAAAAPGSTARREGVVPEFLTLSKTLGGGIPLSATLTTDAIEADCVAQGPRAQHVPRRRPAAGRGRDRRARRDRRRWPGRARGAAGRPPAARLRGLADRHATVGDVRGPRVCWPASSWCATGRRASRPRASRRRVGAEAMTLGLSLHPIPTGPVGPLLPHRAAADGDDRRDRSRGRPARRGARPRWPDLKRAADVPMRAHPTGKEQPWGNTARPRDRPGGCGRRAGDGRRSGDRVESGEDDPDRPRTARSRRARSRADGRLRHGREGDLRAPSTSRSSRGTRRAQAGRRCRARRASWSAPSRSARAARYSIHAFSFGASNRPRSAAAGGGAGAGKVKVADVEVLKDIDVLTLDSTEGVFTGKHQPTVKVVLFDPGTTTPRATYTFRDVLFTAARSSSAPVRSSGSRSPTASHAHHRRATLRVEHHAEQEGLTRAAPVCPHRADGRGSARASTCGCQLVILPACRGKPTPALPPPTRGGADPPSPPDRARRRSAPWCSRSASAGADGPRVARATRRRLPPTPPSASRRPPPPRRCPPPCRARARSSSTARRTANKVALTFDDGSCDACIGSVLADARADRDAGDAVPERRLRALLGPARAPRSASWSRAGSIDLGNHTWSHNDVRTQSAAMLKDELQRNEDWMRRQLRRLVVPDLPAAVRHVQRRRGAPRRQVGLDDDGHLERGIARLGGPRRRRDRGRADEAAWSRARSSCCTPTTAPPRRRCRASLPSIQAKGLQPVTLHAAARGVIRPGW